MKLAQGLSHGDLLKLAKRLEMALDFGSNAASSKDIETNFQNVEDEEDGELSMTYGSFLAKGDRVLGKTVYQRCPDFNFFDPSLLPGASVSSSVKTDGFCSGAAGPVFCSLSPAFLLEIWITRISSSTGRVASGEW